MSSTSNRSRTPPSPNRPVIQTHRRYAYNPLPGNLFEMFIEHVEYVVDAAGGMGEHIWARRFLGTVDKRTKDRAGVQP